MKLVSLTAVVMTVALAAGCATATETASTMKTAAKSTMKKVMGGSAIAEAKASLAAADKVGCAWTTTSKLIKKAEKLEADGKTDKANTVAAKASREADNSMGQCKSEAERLAGSSKKKGYDS